MQKYTYTPEDGYAINRGVNPYIAQQQRAQSKEDDQKAPGQGGAGQQKLSIEGPTSVQTPSGAIMRDATTPPPTGEQTPTSTTPELKLILQTDNQAPAVSGDKSALALTLVNNAISQARKQPTVLDSIMKRYTYQVYGDY